MFDPAEIAAFEGSAVLVTGAGGFIGLHLCRLLLAMGACVHAVTRRPSASAIPPDATIHHADLFDDKAVDQLYAQVRPAFVFHLASRVSGSRALAEVGPTFRDNLASTVHLLRNVAADSDCRRIVLAGSLEESPGAAPSSPYAAAKGAASDYARMFHHLYKTPVTLARLFMVYGPGQQDLGKLVPYVATSLLKGERPRLTSGVRSVDWVYVEDVAKALARCATTPGLDGKTIDVGTGTLTTVRSVAEQISRLVGAIGQPVFGAIDDRPDEQVRAADPAPVTHLLGHRPTRLDDGLRQTVDWYRRQITPRQDS